MKPEQIDPLRHLAQFLGLAEPRVVEIFSELDAARRIAALPVQDGVGFARDAAALLVLTALLDPPPGRAVEAADALSQTVATRHADLRRLLSEATEPLPVPLPEMTALLIAGCDSARSLTVGIEGNRVAASLCLDISDDVSLTLFSGPAFAGAGSGVSGRAISVRCDALPGLGKRMNCIEIEAASDFRN